MSLFRLPGHLKRIPFNRWSQERLLRESKTATSRTSQYGNIGDTFRVGDKTFEFTDISKKKLGDIAQNHYLEEGAKSPEEFIEVWNSLHPKGFDPDQIVDFHKFRELKPTVYPEELPAITSPLAPKDAWYQKALESAATPGETLASELSGYIDVLYSKLLRETDTGKAQALRKEIQYLSETKKIALLSPEQAQKRLDNLRTVKRMQAQIQPAPPAAPAPETRFFADWMESIEESLRMEFDKKKGTYSAAVSRGTAGLKEPEGLPILQPGENYGRHWHDFSRRREIVGRFFSRKDGLPFTDDDLVNFKLNRDGRPIYTGDDDLIVPAQWLTGESERTTVESLSAYYSRHLRPEDIPKGMDIRDPRSPEVFKEAVQPYSPLAMKQQSAWEAEKQLVRGVTQGMVLTPGEVIYITRRGGIEKIKSDIKARLINEILYGHVTPATKGPVSPQAAVREWIAHASAKDASFAKWLIGDEDDIAKEAIKHSQISDVLALRREGTTGIDAAFEEWLKTVPKEDADVLMRRAGGKEKLIEEIKSTVYAPEEWRTITVKQLRELPIVKNPRMPQYYLSHKVSLKGIAIEEHPSTGTGPIQQKLWFIDTSVGAETEKKKILITTFKGEGAPEIPLLQEVELKGVFAQPYGPEGRYWNVNIKPTLGSRVTSVGKEELLEKGKEMGLISPYPKPKPAQSIVHDMDVAKPHKIDPLKGTITFTTKSGEVVERKIPRLEKRGIKPSVEGDPLDEFEDELLMMGAFPLAFTTAMGVGAGLPAVPVPGPAIKVISQEMGLAVARLEKEIAARAAIEQQKARVKAPVVRAYAAGGELGGIWSQKVSEAIQRYEERVAEYRGEAAEGTMPAYRRYLPIDFGLTILDALGAALHPVLYPGQAIWGEYTGTGAMEGVRGEITPAEALGIEDPWKGLAADIMLDPINLVFLPSLARKAIPKIPDALAAMRTEFSGVRKLLADERAEFSMITEQPAWERAGMSRSAYVRRMLEKSAPPAVRPASPAPLIPWKYAAGAGLIGAGLYGLAIDREEPIEPFPEPPRLPHRPASTSTPISVPPSSLSPEYWEHVAALYRQLDTGIESPAISPAAQPTQIDAAIETALDIVDILNTVNYAIGALISGRDFSEKTLISEALGITVKDTPLLSWRGAAGLAADIFLDPLTYATFGGAAAVKIGAAGTRRIALNARGVRALAELKKTHGAEAEGMLATAMAGDPKLYGKLHAMEGIGFRTWGPVIGGKFEYEVVSRETLGQIAAAPGSINEEILRRMITSGRVPLEKAAVAIKGAEMSAAQKAALIRDVVGEALVPFYRVKKLKRPASLAPAEPEYVDRFLRFKKTVRTDIQKYVKIAEDLAKRARAELGEDYNEILMKHLEMPVLPRTGLSKETQDILNTIEDYHKMFAIGEKHRDILEGEIPGYLRHALTREAREYLREGGKVSTEVYGMKEAAGFAEKRTYKGTIEDINTRFRAKMGVDFDLFEPHVPAAFGIRAAEHARAIERYDFLEWVAKHYGEDVTRITDPGKFAYTTIPQLGARLPPEVDRALLQDARDIINQIDPARIYTAKTGITFTAQDVFKDLEAFGLMGTKAAPLPRQQERVYAAMHLSKLLEGVPPGEAADYARVSVLRTQLPKEIVEHLDPEILPKETADYFKAYDKALTAWKFGQTVPWPAYHAQNIAGGLFNTMLLAEMRIRSAGEALSMLTGKSKAKEHITALGDKYTTEEILISAEKLGVTGQPGAMDIPKEIKDVGEYIKHRTSEKLIDRTGVAWSKVSPTTVARTEEDWMRVSIFYDRLMRGDTPEDAAKYVAKFLFEYMPEGKTAFEMSYLRRMIPFYTWMRGNVPLQFEYLLTQPGKYAAFARTTGAAMGEQELPEWAGEWDVTVPAGGGYFYDLRTSASDIDRMREFAYALTGPAQTEEDLFRKLKVLEITAPIIKGPAEVATGWNVFAQRPYDSRTEAALSNLLGKPYGMAVRAEEIQGYRGTERYPRKVEDILVQQTTSVGRYKTQTRKDLEESFKEATRRREDFTWEQRFEAWQRDMMASPLSGIPYELQGGHMLAVAEGGKAEMSNLLTMTIEENLEQTASQMFRLGLPEKLFKQEEFWEEMDIKYETKLEEKTEETKERLEKQGKWVNAAVEEKLEYDTRKATNIQLYSRELAKVRMQRDWAARKLRTEIRSLERKKQDPEFKGDPWSERQIEALALYFIPKCEAKYAQIERLREDERAKEFELPEQIIRGEDFSRLMLGREREVVIRGKGPALARPEDITNMITYEEIAMDRAYILGDVAVVDLSKYLPEHLRKEIKQPTGQPWEMMQELARKYDIEIETRRGFFVKEPEAIIEEPPMPPLPTVIPVPRAGVYTTPVIPVFPEPERAIEVIDVPREEPPAKVKLRLRDRPVMPPEERKEMLERLRQAETPEDLLTVLLPLDIQEQLEELEAEPPELLEPPPHVVPRLPRKKAEELFRQAEKTDAEKTLETQWSQEMIYTEFLESSDFYDAVQTIVIETLDRGNER